MIRSTGGALRAVYGISSKIINSNFSDNAAKYGGAIHISHNQKFNISGCRFVTNKAEYQGGAMEINSSNGSIINCAFIRNNASVGGAISTEIANLTSSNTTFQENTAMRRCGALHFSKSFSVTFKKLKCVNNSASSGGCGCVSRYSRFLCKSCLFGSNTALKGNGGGLYLGRKFNSEVVLQLEEAEFKQNRARLGGALYIAKERLDSTACNNTSGFCGGVALLGTRFISNSAKVGGSLSCTNDFEAIRIDCSSSYLHPESIFMTKKEFHNLTILTEQSLCNNEDTNLSSSSVAKKLAFGAESARVEVVYPSKTRDEVSGKKFIILEFKSGDILPEIHVELVDSYGNGPAFSPENTIHASLSSPDRLFQGVIRKKFRSGRHKWTNIRGYGSPGLYSLKLTFNNSHIAPVFGTVKVRNCTVNESPKGDNNEICETCGPSLYRISDKGSQDCQACPSNANCTGKFIVPNDGHWHSHPCQIKIERCLEKSACSYTNRIAVLTALTENISMCSFNETFLDDYETALCQKGYKGVVCGSCATGFDRSGPFTCAKCWNKGAIIATLCLRVLWLLGLAIIVFRSNLPLTPAVMLRSRLIREAIDDSEAPNLREESINLDLATKMYMGVVSCFEIETPPKRDRDESQDLRELELSKWRMGEFIKLMVNYLQTIATAASLNMDWESGLSTMFYIAEYLGGFTTQAMSVSLGCFLDKNSTYRPLLSMIYGLLLPMFVCFCIIAALAIAQYRNKTCTGFLWRRIALAMAIGLYISYLGITKLATNPFPCLDISIHDMEQPTKESFWVMDTSLKCNEGEHVVLLFLGSFVLLCFTFTLPVFSLVILLHHRETDKLKSPWVFETLGFLYKAFQPQYVYWESIVLLRKALLSIILIFSYRLGVELQSQLIAFLLVLSLFIHQRCSPYGEHFTDLNDYESFSLFVTSLTYILGLFFHHEDTTNSSRILLASLLVSANTGFFLYLLFKLLLHFNRHLRISVKCLDSPCPDSTPWWRVLKMYLQLKLKKLGECF